MRLYGATVLEADAEVLRHRAVLDYAWAMSQQLHPPEAEEF